MAKFLIKYRYWMFGVTLLLSVVCGIAIGWVNVNIDMTKYLPDDSQMRKGLDIMGEEFAGASEMNAPGVRAMFNGLTEDEKLATEKRLESEENVLSVMMSESGEHTLYEVSMPDSVDQKMFGAEIKRTYDKVEEVETGQDNMTADLPMLIGAMVLLLAILFVMCQSWLEPVLFLFSTGIAVIVNMGTNALLPSVSVTTNSIVAVLQFVLSMDYSIILMNRYRQEQKDGATKVEAMQGAVKKASASILSSAATTIVGLLMLVFMKLKIGMDLGVVLAKGVLCSLICNFTFLPTLILMCDKGIEATKKKVLPIPTDKIAKVSVKFRIPLAILFVVIFAGSFYLHNKTTISFSTNGESKIDKVFPKKNIAVILYETADEGAIPGLVDSLMADKKVDMVISYPSLLQRQYTSRKMVESVREMATMSGDTTMTGGLQMLTDDMLRLAYYATHRDTVPLAVPLRDLMRFVMNEVEDTNSMMAGYLDADMVANLQLLKELVFADEEEDAKGLNEIKHYEAPARKTKTQPQVAQGDPSHSDAVAAPIAKENVEKRERVPQGYEKFADENLINRTMTSADMAQFMDMDKGQAKTVYKLAKRSGEGMTPLEFVHFMTRDIFKRKALAAMIKSSEKAELRKIENVMETALAHGYAEAEEELPAAPPIEPQHQISEPQNVAPAITSEEKEPIVVKAPETRKNDAAMTKFNRLMESDAKLTADQLYEGIKPLGYPIDKAMIELMYLYYGSQECYNIHWTMSLEQLLGFVSDSVMKGEKYAAFVDEGMRKEFAKAEAKMGEELNMLRGKKHSIAVVVSSYKDESEETYAFVNRLKSMSDRALDNDCYFIGESVMFDEMRNGFGKEMLLITILTVLSIFLIVAITFRSVAVPTILVMTIMSAVFVNVTVSGVGGGTLLYLAYLIVQSILMGATIDYGILFASYYRERREEMNVYAAVKEAYKGSIHTIATSGLIMIVAPGVLAMFLDDATISSILSCISVGAFVAVLLIVLVLPGLLAASDKMVVKKKKKQ